MGQFSWLYSNTGKAMKDGKVKNSYLLVPPPFQDKYGKYILETCYDGYGRFNGYDVYDLVLEWNREYLDKSMLIKPERSKWRPEDGEFYLNAVKIYERMIERLLKYKNGATDDEMLEFCEDRYWKRELGIEISCYDEQNRKLPFPIKITSKKMEYDEALPSDSDPNQGW